MASSRQIEEQAGAWLAKRDSGEWTRRDESELSQWLSAATAHYIAFIRLEAAWEEARRLKALSDGTGIVPPPGRWRFSVFRAPPVRRDRAVRPSRLFAAAAAACAVLAGTSLVYEQYRGERYATPVGGIASWPIADGSKITLNTNSKVRVALSKDRRLIELAQGEAFFEVAPDADRPFVVSAGKQRVIALGTQFSVRREGNQLRVIVTEGLVRLEEDGEVAKSPERSAQLAVGSVARTTVDKVMVDRRPLEQVEEYLSWRSGYLVFHESSLADAVAEFNRYNTQKILIQDPALADLRFSGKLRAVNVDAFVRILENGFPVRALAERDRIVLTARS